MTPACLKVKLTAIVSGQLMTQCGRFGGTAMTSPACTTMSCQCRGGSLFELGQISGLVDVVLVLSLVSTRKIFSPLTTNVKPASMSAWRVDTTLESLMRTVQECTFPRLGAFNSWTIESVWCTSTAMNPMNSFDLSVFSVV